MLLFNANTIYIQAFDFLLKFNDESVFTQKDGIHTVKDKQTERQTDTSSLHMPQG